MQNFPLNYVLKRQILTDSIAKEQSALIEFWIRK